MSVQEWNWSTSNYTGLHPAEVEQNVRTWEAPNHDVYITNAHDLDYTWQEREGESPQIIFPKLKFRASAAQVQAAYTALTGQGLPEDFNQRVWNDIVDKIVELQTEWEVMGQSRLCYEYEDGLGIHAPWREVKMDGSAYISSANPGYVDMEDYEAQTWGIQEGNQHYNLGRTLRANKFKLCVSAFVTLPKNWIWAWEQDLAEIKPGQYAYGRYILDLVRAINHWCGQSKLVFSPFINLEVNEQFLANPFLADAIPIICSIKTPLTITTGIRLDDSCPTTVFMARSFSISPTLRLSDSVPITMNPLFFHLEMDDVRVLLSGLIDVSVTVQVETLAVAITIREGESINRYVLMDCREFFSMQALSTLIASLPTPEITLPIGQTFGISLTPNVGTSQGLTLTRNGIPIESNIVVDVENMETIFLPRIDIPLQNVYNSVVEVAPSTRLGSQGSAQIITTAAHTLMYATALPKHTSTTLRVQALSTMIQAETKAMSQHTEVSLIGSHNDLVYAISLPQNVQENIRVIPITTLFGGHGASLQSHTVAYTISVVDLETERRIVPLNAENYLHTNNSTTLDHQVRIQLSVNASTTVSSATRMSAQIRADFNVAAMVELISSTALEQEHLGNKFITADNYTFTTCNNEIFYVQ